MMRLGLGLGLSGRQAAAVVAGSFWAAYPTLRLHDANDGASLSDADGAQVTSWADISGNELPPYDQVGTGVTAQTAGGERYIISAATSHLLTAGGADLRGTEGYMLTKTPSSSIAMASSMPGDNPVQIKWVSGPLAVFSFDSIYGVSGDVMTTPTTHPAGNWVVVRYAMTNNDGALLQVNNGTPATLSGDFSANPAQAFSVRSLMSRYGGGFANTGFAVISVAAEGAWDAGQHAAIYAHLAARRDALNA